MNIGEIRNHKAQSAQIAAELSLNKVSVFGLVVREESNKLSDIDFLIKLADAATALGVGGFQYETEQLPGIEVDGIPTLALSSMADKAYGCAVEPESIEL